MARRFWSTRVGTVLGLLARGAALGTAPGAACPAGGAPARTRPAGGARQGPRATRRAPARRPALMAPEPGAPRWPFCALFLALCALLLLLGALVCALLG